MSDERPSQTWNFPARRVGRTVWIFDQLDSTNSFALSLTHDRRQDGLAILARTQTAGRGQYGRTWQAPAGSSVLLSLVAFPPPALRRPALLTAWAAVSVCDVIERCIGVEARIKWPNDVFVAGKKVCGILIERRSSPEDEAGTVVGIGLNVRQNADLFIEAGLPYAGSLFSVSATLFDSEEVAGQLLDCLDEHYKRLETGDLSLVEVRWREGLALVGKRVSAELASGNIHGQLIDVSLNSVKLVDDSRKVIEVPPEAVRHLSQLGKESAGTSQETSTG